MIMMFQSRISESQEEVKEVLRLNPGCMNYAEVYDKCDVLTNKVRTCILNTFQSLANTVVELL